MSARTLKSRRVTKGMSLIELMVSLTLGMLIIITIGSVYIGASRTFRMLEANSRLQENARYAIERISFDLRMAGYTGCSSQTYTNVLQNTTAWQYNLYGKPLIGYEQGQSTFPTLSGHLRGDAITIIRADNSNEYIVSSHEPSSATIHLASNADLRQGEILIATDCSHTALFQKTNPTGNNDEVVHNTGSSISPGNYTKGFKIPDNLDTKVFTPAALCAANASQSFCNDTNGSAYTFGDGSRIFRILASTYYIGTNTANEPALYRMKLGTTTGNASTTAEEIVEGIEDMQITYGMDTTTEADKIADTYLTANEIETAMTGITSEEAWKRVLSVRISLLMVTRSGEETTDKAQQISFNGQVVNRNDRKLRKVFNTTIAVRNRL